MEVKDVKSATEFLEEIVEFLENETKRTVFIKDKKDNAINFINIISLLKQKVNYVVKKEFRIEVEAKDEKTLNGFEKFLTMIDTEYGEHGDIKVNIKEVTK